MIALMIISLIISAVPLFIVMDMADEGKTKKTTAIWAFGCWVIALWAWSFLIMIDTQQNMLNKSNPYKKEYTYKQLPSGEYVKTDSSYVRIKTKDHGGKREK